MKSIFITLILSLSIPVFSQVPQRENRRDYSTEVAIPVDESESKNVGYYQQNKKYGFVYPVNNKQEALFDLIQFGANGFIVKKNNLYGITDNKGVLIGKIEFDSIGTLMNNAYIVKRNGLYGTCSPDGSPILSLKYKKIMFSDGKNPISILLNKKDEVQLLFNENEKLFPQKIEYAGLYNNLAIIKSNGKFGVLKDQVVLPFEYDSIYVPTNEMYRTNPTTNKVKETKPAIIAISRNSTPAHLLVIKKGEKVGLINSDGKIIFPPENDAVINHSSFGFYTIKKDNLYGIYFNESKTNTAIAFEKVTKDGIGFVMAVKNNKAGVFNLKGQQIVPFEYDDNFIMQLSGIGFKVAKDKKKGIIDKTGKVLVPTIYDEVGTFYENGFNNFIKVEAAGKSGIVNLQGEMIIPCVFDWIGEENGMFKVAQYEPERKFGLFDKAGAVVIPATYQWITDSDTQNSKITVLKKDANSYNFLNTENAFILPENALEYGYVLDEDNLLNPFSSNKHYLLYVKNKNGKYGMINETSGTLAIPFLYDAIIQKCETEKHTYYSVKKGKKFGLIDEQNQVILPFKYDAIDLNFSRNHYNDETDYTPEVVVKKGKKFGTVNFKNEIQIPFQYNDLQRIASIKLYKAKKGTKYQIIDAKGIAINVHYFDEVANFEEISGNGFSSTATQQALTFLDGKMRVIDNKGAFLTSEITMKPHKGFTTFDALKLAFIAAMDSSEELLLKDFSEKIAPSQHLLFYLKNNIFDENSLAYTNVDYIQETYFKNLLDFKLSRWSINSGYAYKRTSLTNVADYTMSRKRVVTNARNQDHAFGDTRFLEKVLRNAIKVNGFWISTYFMTRNFN